MRNGNRSARIKVTKAIASPWELTFRKEKFDRNCRSMRVDRGAIELKRTEQTDKLILLLLLMMMIV